MNRQKLNTKWLLCYLIVISSVFCFSANSQDLEKELLKAFPEYEKACNSYMKELHQLWIEADGFGTLILEQKLFWALLLEPEYFYDEFSDDTYSFNRFKDHLDGFVFTDFKDRTTVNMERLQLVAIDRLVDLTYSIDSSHIQIHKEMIERLRQVKVSFVD